MSWEFKRDEDFLRRRAKVVDELHKIDVAVRDVILADFIIMYNSWNMEEMLKALKELGVDNEQTKSSAA